MCDNHIPICRVRTDYLPPRIVRQGVVCEAELYLSDYWFNPCPSLVCAICQSSLDTAQELHRQQEDRTASFPCHSPWEQQLLPQAEVLSAAVRLCPVLLCSEWHSEGDCRGSCTQTKGAGGWGEWACEGELFAFSKRVLLSLLKCSHKFQIKVWKTWNLWFFWQDRMEVITRDKSGFVPQKYCSLSKWRTSHRKHLLENSDRMYLYQDVLQNLVIDIVQQSSVISLQIYVHMTNTDSSP